MYGYQSDQMEEGGLGFVFRIPSYSIHFVMWLKDIEEVDLIQDLTAWKMAALYSLSRY